MEKCSCALCDKDLLFRDAVNCSACQGLCHGQCTVGSTVHTNDEVEFMITCKKCYHSKALVSTENSNESPTSPLLLQRQEFINRTKNKAEKLADFDHSSVPVKTLQPSSELRSITSSKSGSKGKRKLCTWGLIWRKKNGKDTGTDFRLNNILLKGPGMNYPGVLCHICRQPYNCDLMYIRCEFCSNWYHAEAVELEESKIFELTGFKCCRCRRIKSPACPYAEGDKKKHTDEKIRVRATKHDEMDSSLEVISEPFKLDPVIPVLPAKERVVHVEDDPLLYNHTKVEEQCSSVGYECNAPTLSGFGPQKLPVRRHIKHEKDVDNPSRDELSAFGGNILNSAEDALSGVEWDVTTNDDDEGLMFNYEDISYQDMAFEPQTYFSFNELLASDDGAPQNVVGSAGNVAENWENSFLFPEDEDIDISFDQQESTGVVESVADVEPCRMCYTEPRPDRCCEICGLWIHSHCSPWEELLFRDNAWRCGNCREW